MAVKMWLTFALLGVLCYSSAIDAATDRILCYWGTWSVYYPGAGKFDTTNMDPFLCTHLIYAFAGLDEVTNTIIPLDPWNDLGVWGGNNNYHNAVHLKRENPDLKVLIAVGGWNEGSIKYSRMVSTAASRQTFIKSVSEFIRLYGFDGIDIDWEYPTKRGGLPTDRENFVKLLQEFREEFDSDPNKPLLSIAVGAGQDTIDRAYDVPEISKYVDYMNVMTYDYQMAETTNKLSHHCPLHSKSVDSFEEAKLNAEWTMNYLIQLGAPPKILNLGLSAYGRSYTLRTGGQTEINVDFNNGAGQAGEYTQEMGMLGYFEICDRINNRAWKAEYDDAYDVPYAYSSNEWVGYDDEISVQHKIDFAKKNNIGGVMIWSWDLDSCAIRCGNKPKCSLLTTIKEKINSP